MSSNVLRLECSHPLRSFTLEATFQLEAGKTLAILGHSGAGKTTLLKIVAGLLRPPQAQLSVGNDPWIDTQRQIFVDARKRYCGYAPQGGVLFESLNVWRNVTFGVAKGSRQRKRQLAEELLAQFQLEGFADRYPHELSGGERQRVNLARAIAIQPRVLLLDEPFTGLDRRIYQHTQATLLQQISTFAPYTLLVTHDLAQMQDFADQTLSLENGKMSRSQSL